MAIIRFFRGGLLLGSAEIEEGDFIVDVADRIGIDIPRNCTSGNCGTCLVRLIAGNIETIIVIVMEQTAIINIEKKLISDGILLKK